MKSLQMENEQKNQKKKLNFDEIVGNVNKVFNGTANIDEAIKTADQAFNDSFNLKTAIKKANKNFNELQKN